MIKDPQELKDKLTKVIESPNLIEFFEKNARQSSVKLKKGTFLFNEGQPLNKIFVIKKGFVKLYRLSEEGKETTIYLLGPGYVAGIRAFVAKDECARHNAETLTDAEVIALSHDEYLELISISPEYLLGLLQTFMNRLLYTEKKLEGFIVGNTTLRIANFLVDIYERFCDKQSFSSNKKSEKIILPLPLTHQRIGEFIGAFRETVTVSLHQLEKEKIISFDQGYALINDLKALKKYSSN